MAVGSTESDTDAPPRRRIGDYEILERLGSGGMGVVYRARDVVHDRDVALKLVAPHRLDSGAARTRMLREARAQASLSHPNIAQVFATGEDEGLVWIAMECLSGPTLASCEVTAERVIRWTNDLARALEHAHAAGHVHRDLKPTNVMLDSKGRAKIVDFGLVKTVAIEDDTQTIEGAVLGTPRYMSPEQARGGTVGPASDIYSLGVMLSELCERTAVSARLTALVRDCLERNPERRPTAHEVADRASRLARPRRPAIAALASVMLLSLGATTTWFVVRNDDTGSPPLATRVLTPHDPRTYLRSTVFDQQGTLYYANEPTRELWRVRPNAQPERVPSATGTYMVECCFRGMPVLFLPDATKASDHITRLLGPGDQLLALPDLQDLVSISHDGRWTIRASDGHCPESGSEVRDERTGQTRHEICLEGDRVSHAYRWSPSSHRLAFFRTLGTRVELLVVTLGSSRPPTSIVAFDAPPTDMIARGLVWKSDDRLVFLDARPTPRLIELVLSSDDTVAQRIEHAIVDVAEPIAVYGNRVAMLHHRDEGGTVLGSLDSARPLTWRPMGNTPVVFASDGRIVTMSRESDGAKVTALVVRDLDGPNTVLVRDEPGVMSMPRAIAIGERTDRVLFVRRGGVHSLWRVDIDGANLHRIMDMDPTSGVRCGGRRCIVTKRIPATRTIEVFDLDVSDGTQQPLFAFETETEQDRQVPTVSPDGLHVAVVDQTLTAILVFDTLTKQIRRRAVPNGKQIQDVVFGTDGALLFVENSYLDGRGVARLLPDDTVEVLSGDGYYYSILAADPPRRRFAVSRSGHTSSLEIAPMP